MLTKEQKSLLFALCLGDGYVSKQYTGNSNCEFDCTHSIKQLEYLKWKRDLVYSILGGLHPPKISEKDIYLKRINKKYKACRFCKRHPYFTYLRNVLYPNGIKYLSLEALDMLTAQGLAIWFMDDGWGYNIKNRKGIFTTRMCIGIETDSFSKEENEFIIYTIFKKFGIKFRLGRKKSPESNKLLWFIKTSSQAEIKKFIDVVSPFIVDSMKYKIENKITKIHECDTPQKGEDIV